MEAGVPNSKRRNIANSNQQLTYGMLSGGTVTRTVLLFCVVFAEVALYGVVSLSQQMHRAPQLRKEGNERRNSLKT
eukprot:2681608-Amphidinium_carterae.1